MGSSIMSGVFEMTGAGAQASASYVQMEAADNASRVAQGDARLQVKQMELGATQREADRKEALNKALASQNAMTGASGITSMGSPGSVMDADMDAEGRATQRDRFMTDLEKRATAYRSTLQRKFDKNARRTGQFAAFNQWLSTTGSAAGGMMGGME